MPTNPEVEFTPSVMVFTVDLPNFPEWAISFTKIIPKAYLDDGYNIEDFTGTNLITTCRHWWRCIADNHWELRVEVRATAKLNNVYIPIYLDIDLVVINERVWEELNANKV